MRTKIVALLMIVIIFGFIVVGHGSGSRGYLSFRGFNNVLAPHIYSTPSFGFNIYSRPVNIVHRPFFGSLSRGSQFNFRLAFLDS